MKNGADGAKPESTTRYLVPVVESTFRILEELSRSGPLGLNDVARLTKVSKSTVFRVLSTLTHLGYVSRNEKGRTYHLSRSLANLVSGTGETDILRKAALPYMLKLRDTFGETVNLGQLKLDKVLYIEVVPSEHALRLSERPGATVWAHASALGKAILAFSPPQVADSLVKGRPLLALTPNTIHDAEELLREFRRVKARGYAFDKEETALLANCVGTPILDADGFAIAAMSISGPTTRFNPRRDKHVVDGLLDAVSRIAAQVQQNGAFATRG